MKIKVLYVFAFAVAVGIGFLAWCERSSQATAYPGAAMETAAPATAGPSSDAGEIVSGGIVLPRHPQPAPPVAPEPAREAPRAEPAPEARPAPQPPADPDRALFAAIAKVESNNDPFAISRNGRDRGLYQISVLYWRDACKFGGVDWNYYRWVWHADKCEQVMRWYWKKYGARTDEEKARLHNGGPQGHRKAATWRYWRKVRLQMEQ